MKKFFSKKTITKSESPQTTSSSKPTTTSKIKQQEEPVIVEIVEKNIVDKDIVKCMDCGNRTKLFYDMTTTVQDEGDEVDLEGQDLEEDRDPIRCVLCRKYTKCKDNEPIQCEDCLTNGTVFYWTGQYKDIILCHDCYGEDGKDGYESDSFVENDTF